MRVDEHYAKFMRCRVFWLMLLVTGEWQHLKRR